MNIQLDDELSRCIEALRTIAGKPEDVRLLRIELTQNFHEETIKIARMLIRKDLLKCQ